MTEETGGGSQGSQGQPQGDAQERAGQSEHAAGGQPQQAAGEAAGAGGGAQQQWYYSVGGQSFGPVTEQQLIELARAGYFKKDDHVYAAYIGDWVRADSVHGLFDEVGVAEGAAAPAGPLFVPGPASPPGETMYVEYAGFWIRFVAAFIDGLVLALPNCLISSIFQFAILGRGFATPPPTPGSGFAMFPFTASWIAMQAGITITGWTIGWLYYGLMESSRWQATLGKRAVGVMVTDLYGRRISFARASGRYFASIISGLTLSIGYIIGAFTERKQTLHDMIAGTVPIRGRTD